MRQPPTPPSPSPTTALTVRDLRHSYGTGPNAVAVLRGLDLDIAAGTFVAVMGPSGSGKSTLLNLVAGLEPVGAGSVHVEGEDLAAWSEARRTAFRRSRLGVVYQACHLIPYLTAAQNVALPVRLAGRRVRRATVSDLLARVGLADRADHLPGALSGGQQQRVALARALVTDPALILADEPTGALDTVAARQVLGLLRAAVDDLGRTVLMVTHDPVAAARADRVVFLVDGRVAGTMTAPTAEAVAGHLAHLDDLVSTTVTRAVSA